MQSQSRVAMTGHELTRIPSVCRRNPRTVIISPIGLLLACSQSHRVIGLPRGLVHRAQGLFCSSPRVGRHQRAVWVWLGVVHRRSFKASESQPKNCRHRSGDTVLSVLSLSSLLNTGHPARCPAIIAPSKSSPPKPRYRYATAKLKRRKSLSQYRSQSLLWVADRDAVRSLVPRVPGQEGSSVA